ncbi:unnamed protein product [Symbiodinium natans]|uniref:Uncharacterized protein n=1 Tax=Symbiodinium natans TaxID=878477 RepID=A0A812I479_9DINO|nr:unnamed protein product [Symbiodinium natans]CAE6970690.1 unnamed protein product [Symbiodinium natans]
MALVPLVASLLDLKRQAPEGTSVWEPWTGLESGNLSEALSVKISPWRHGAPHPFRTARTLSAGPAHAQAATRVDGVDRLVDGVDGLVDEASLIQTPLSCLQVLRVAEGIGAEARLILPCMVLLPSRGHYARALEP